MATVNNLGEAFYKSLIYFLRSAADLNSDFVDRFWRANPDFPLSEKTLPFVLINAVMDEDDINVQPDTAGYESREMTFTFVIMVYCDTFANQVKLPELVKRTIEKATVSSVDGFQIYKGFDSNGDPDVGSELVVAEPILGNVYPVGGETEEDLIRKFSSAIAGEWSILRDSTKKFIDSDS